MTLYSLFHPLVVYVAAARVDAAQGKDVENGAFYSHVMRELDTIRRKGGSVPELAEAVETACAYTAFYIDYMVHEGPFSFSAQWQDIGRSKYHELAGDEKFFDYMQLFLDDESATATDHLRLMHAMVNSGFSGAYQRRAVELEALLRRVSARIGVAAEADAKAALLTGNRAALTAMRAVHPMRVGVLCLFLGLALFLSASTYYLYMYRQSTAELRDVLSSIRTAVMEDAMLHAHNSDSLVVSPYSMGHRSDEPEPAPAETPTAAPEPAPAAPEAAPQAADPERLLQPMNADDDDDDSPAAPEASPQS